MRITQNTPSRLSNESVMRDTVLLCLLLHRKEEFIPSLKSLVPCSPQLWVKKAAPLVQNRISKSDAVILLTDKPVYEIPSHLHNLKGVCSGRVYLWCSYGVCCALLGGSVNNKRVAMQLRALLEDSDNLLGRILPRPWNLEKMYNVDPKFETGEPCVT